MITMNKLLLLLKLSPALITVAERIKLLFKGEFSVKKAIFVIVFVILSGVAVGTDFLTIDELEEIEEIAELAIELAE